MAFALTILFLVTLSASSQGYIEHSGAYSSPQYAKKNMRYPQNYQRIEPPSPESPRTKFQEIELTERNYTEHQVQRPYPISNSLVTEPQESETSRSTGIMSAAGEFLKRREGQMLSDIVRDLIARSTGASSQVLSLNLTNLVILVVLKALLLAVGMFGAGAWGQGYGRSLDLAENSPWLKEDELELWMNFIHEDGDCLRNAACKYPSMAQRYSDGADVLLQFSKIFKGTVPYEVKFEDITKSVKHAAHLGTSGVRCDAIFKCNK